MRLALITLLLMAATIFTTPAELYAVDYPSNPAPGTNSTHRYANDLAAISLTGPTAPNYGTQSIYTLTISNPGTLLQSGYQIKLFRAQGIEVFSWPGPDIQPGATTNVTMPWIPENLGPETLYGKVSLAGDQDPANDQTPPLNVIVQAVAGVGNGNQQALIPVNMYYRTSLFETIYYASEMNCMGLITDISFLNNFQTPLYGIPISLCLGETTLGDLTGGWIPSSQLTQVFSGNVDFPNGQNEIRIHLDTPYQYGGGNLVLMAYRPWDDDYYSSMDLFFAQTVGTNRSLTTFNDNTTINPDNPPTTGVTGQFPTTRFYLSVNGLGSLAGNVTAGGAPLSGATVSIANTSLCYTTVPGGNYRFPFLPQGAYQVTASKTGYTSVTQTTIVAEYQSANLDFALSPLNQVSVNGWVAGSNAPNLGLANATVSLTGYAEYSETTDAQGNFLFPSVYANQIYTYTISASGYQPAAGQVIIGNANVDMGDIYLNEIAYVPRNVVARENLYGTAVDLEWDPPVTAQETWLHYDNGENFNSFGTAGSLSFEVAIRFPPDALADYAGTSLQAVKIWPAMGGNFAVRVWTGGTNLEPGIMVVNQPIIPVLNSYNTIMLDLPVPITGTEELWFGFLCDVTGINPAYAGVDSGPAVNGFGNMIHWQGSWTTLLAVNAYCDFNWNIQGYVGFSPPPPAPALTPINVSRNKRFDHHDNGEPGPGRDPVYRIWRFLQGQANNEAMWTNLTPNPVSETSFQDPSWPALPDGTYYWAVKAVYIGGVQSDPAFSNPLVKVSPVGTIAGVVRGQSNAPIAGATLTCGSVSATSNAVGAYTMLVSTGTHDVTCSAAGYATQTATGVVVLLNQTTTLNFIMAVDTEADPPVIPETELLGCFPNPFNPSTTISYAVKEPSVVQLRIYNHKGQLVRTLVDGMMAPGAHSAVWDGRDASGLPVSSGVYFSLMKAGKYHAAKKMILLK